MARKLTRKTKAEIRWDSSTGGILPNFRFPDDALLELAKISNNQDLIPLLENYCGIFLLQNSQEATKPTAGDYARTLEDLENVTSEFIDRMKKLRGHELEGVIDSAWYEATTKLPEYDELQNMATTFLKQVRVAQNYAQVEHGRTTSTEAMRDLVSNCKYSLNKCGEPEEEAKTRATVRICIKSMGKNHLLERLRHYC